MRRLVIAAIVSLGLPLVGVVVVTSAGAQPLVVLTDSSSSEPGPDPDPDTSEPFFPTFGVVSATLANKGAAVDVRFTVTCDGAAILRVRVTQRHGNRLVESTEGEAFVNDCTREPQTVTVRASVATSGARFRKAMALVDTRFDWEDLFPLFSSDYVRIR